MKNTTIKTIQIPGQRLENQTVEVDYDLIEFEKVEFIQVEAKRSNVKPISINYDEKLIANVFFEDGSEWIGSIEDIHDVIPKQETRGRDTSILTIPKSYPGEDNTRGIFDIIIKAIHFLKLDSKVVETGVKEIAQQLDQKRCPQPGLFKLEKRDLFTPVHSLGVSQPILVMIHGTMSNINESYGDLFSQNDQFPEPLKKIFNGHIYGFQHHTLTKSPLENAHELLEILPSEVELNILSFSRGGLVADVISKCDVSNDTIGFSDEEIYFINKNGSKEDAQWMAKITQLAKEKKIKVRRITRVAVPAAGTILASKRMDYILNGLLSAAQLSTSFLLNSLVKSIKTLLLAVIESKSKTDVLPGIESMNPESSFIQLINNPLFGHVNSELAIIKGNATLGNGIKRSSITLLTKLFYWRGNDWVVNTDSMDKGVYRINGFKSYLFSDGHVSHFDYFGNSNSAKVIIDSLDYNTPLDNQKDIRLGSLIEGNNRGSMVGLGNFHDDQVSGEKPIVIFLPGILGSHLAVDDNDIYLNLWRIFRGGLVDQLHLDADVTPSGVIKKYYKPLWNHIENKNIDCRIFPYDWRKSTVESAEILKNLIEEYQKHDVTISIIAHSMGGLVVRSMMMNYEKEWNDFITLPLSRLIMLGTPWNGSHLIVELLTGHLARLNLLHKLDAKNSKKEVLDTIKTFPGIYDLLPINHEPFEEASYWEDLIEQVKDNNKYVTVPSSTLLTHFKKYKEKALDHKIKEEHKDSIIYIAGQSDYTTDGYEIKPTHFGNFIQYVGTTKGDSSVTWELGIPKDIDPAHLYYCDVSHGELSSDSSLYDGIMDLLQHGTTEKLSRTRPTTQGVRGGDQEAHLPRPPQSDDLLDQLYGIPERSSKKEKTETPTLKVKLRHGNIIFASNVIMLGHFNDDGILNAEAALNAALSDSLQERHRLDIYPEQVGENLILIKNDNNIKGALIVGLGDVDQLSQYALSQSVEAGILRYSFSRRDNNTSNRTGDPSTTSISTICIASGFGGLTHEESLTAILSGVIDANKKIIVLDSGLPTINEIEFVEIYEDIAKKISYTIRRLEESKTNGLNFKFNNDFRKIYGAKKRNSYNVEKNWWINITTEIKESGTPPKENFNFKLSDGSARIQDETNYAETKIIDFLLKEMSSESTWSPELSKTLFELVIPNTFKGRIRNQNNILWRLDAKSAEIPWEMFHDKDLEVDPFFVKTGLIRQLNNKNSRQNPEIVRSKSALIIANPIYEELSQLPAAEKEGKLVHELLQEARVDVVDQIFQSPDIILKSLFTQKFKILHIAGHGVFDPITRETGIVIGDMIISPATLNQLSVIPEFAFINCCYSGAIDAESEEYTSQRNKLASNIGTQLIQMGVKAVVITGWAIDDQAAFQFAQTFYERMLSGSYFGKAVTDARYTTYDLYKHTDTWGAYQCYGDPWYKFAITKTTSSQSRQYIDNEDIQIDLENLKEESMRVQTKDKMKEIVKDLDEIINASSRTRIKMDAATLELVAEVYATVNLYDEAIIRYEEIFDNNYSDFKMTSVENYCKLIVRSAYHRDRNSERVLQAELSEIESKVKSLLSVGNSARKHTIMGSMYKKYYTMATSDKKTQKYINQMLANYKNGYETVEYGNSSEYYYPLINYIYSLILKDGMDATISIKGDIIPISKCIEDLHIDLHSYRYKNEDFWKDVALVHVQTLQIFFAKEDQLEDLPKNNKLVYERAWKKGGNYANLIMELEQFHFLLKAIKSIKGIQALDKKIKILEEFESFLIELPK